MDEEQLHRLVATKRASLGYVDDALPATPPPSALAASRGVRVAPPPEEGLEPPSPVFHLPVAPDLNMVDMVHRGHDGYIPFASREGSNGWRELGCVKASKLPTLFKDELFTTAVEVDGYFGLHGMFSPARFKRRTTLDSLLPSLRQTKYVRWLTALHVDLDLYNVGVDPEDGVATVLRAAREGVIPHPSLFSISRGCWVVWLLKDEEHGGAVRAWPENQRVWSVAQGELHNRLRKLGSDRAALHAATLTRIPGTFNTKNRKRVAYMSCMDDAGQLITYTLPELFNVLGVTPPPTPYVVDASTPPASSTPKDPSRVERGKRGYTGRWSRFLAVLNTLRDMRGGWRVGHRSKAVFFFALAMKAKGLTSGKPARVAMERFLEGMEQPPGDQFTLDHALKALKAAAKPKRGGVNWQTVADELDISPDEAAMLSTNVSRIPPARRFDHLPDPATVPPKELTLRRRAAVKRIVEALGFVPTCERLRECLVADGFDPAAPATLLKDLDAVGHPSPRKKPRAPRPDRQTSLPDHVLDDTPPPPEGEQFAGW